MNQKTVLVTLFVLILGIALLAACQPTVVIGPAQNGASPVANSSPFSMADRILFQDRVLQQPTYDSPDPAAGLTMADRIRFQDQLYDPAPSRSPILTMADRIQFQDNRTEP